MTPSLGSPTNIWYSTRCSFFFSSVVSKCGAQRIPWCWSSSQAPQMAQTYVNIIRQIHQIDCRHRTENPHHILSKLDRIFHHHQPGGVLGLKGHPLDQCLSRISFSDRIPKTYPSDFPTIDQRQAIVKRLKQERMGFDNQLAGIERTLKAPDLEINCRPDPQWAVETSWAFKRANIFAPSWSGP